MEVKFQLRKVNTNAKTNDIDEKIRSLGRMTKNRKAARKISRNKDTVRTLLESLKSKPKFTKMVEYSVDCLKNLAVDEMSVEEMIDEDTIEVLTKVMQLNPYNEKIQRVVSDTLAVFAKNERLAEIIQERLGEKQMIHSLKKHVETATLVSTSAAICNLMLVKDNVDKFVKADVISSVGYVIETNDRNIDVMMSSVKVLDCITSYPEHIEAVVATGCTKFLVESMHMYNDSTEIKHLLSFIAKITKVSTKATEELRKLNFVDKLVSILEHHADHDNILNLAAESLTMLTDMTDTTDVLKIDPTLIGGILANAVSKFASMALVNDNVEYFVNMDGVSWLVSALKTASPLKTEDATKIVTQCLLAMKRVAIDEPKIYTLMTSGAIDAILDVFKTHADNEDVVSAAVNALTSMLTRKENGDYFVQSGAVTTVLEMMSAHKGNVRIARAVMEFLEKACLHSEVVAQLFNIKAHESIVETLKLYPNDDIVAKHGLTALGRMCNTQEHQLMIVDTGAFKEIITILQEQKDNSEIVSLCFNLIIGASMDTSTCDILKRLNCVDHILAALEVHSNDELLCIQGGEAMNGISGLHKQDDLSMAVSSVASISHRVVQEKNLAILQGELNDAVTRIGNLSVVEDNIELLIQANCPAALLSAIQSTYGFAYGDTNNISLTSIHGLLRMMASPVDGVNIAIVISQSDGLIHLLKSCIEQPENTELIISTLKLVETCSIHTEVKEKLISDGVIIQLLELASLSNSDESILKHVTCTLNRLCINEVTSNIIISYNNMQGINTIIENLMINLNDPHSVMESLELIGKLALNDDSLDKLIQANIIDSILSVLRRYSEHNDIVLGCITNLTNLLLSEEIAIEIGEKGGVDMIIKAIRTYYQNEILCESSMILLDSLGTVKTTQNMILEQDGLQLTNWIMEAYSTNEVIQEAGNNLLISLKAQEEHKERLIEITQAASIDISQANVMFSDASVALHQLTELSGLVQNPANAAMLLQTGGLNTLAGLLNDQQDENAFYEASDCFLSMLDAADDMSSYVNDPTIVNALCSMINASENFDVGMDLAALTKAIRACSKLKLKGNVLEGLLKGDPFTALMKILTYSDDEELLIQASKLLGKLSNKKKIAKKLQEIANLRTFTKSIRRNIKNEEFVKYCAIILSNLALHDDCKLRIGTEGGVTLLVQAMELHGGNEKLLENCLYALANLSYQSAVNNGFIVSVGGVSLTCSIIATYSTSEDLLDSAVTVLCNLCFQNDQNKELIVKSGGASVIADVVLNNFNSHDLLITCFRTLGNLSYNAVNVSQIVQSGGVQGIVAGMTVHNDNLDIVEVAIRVLTNLAAYADKKTMEIMCDEGAVQAIIEGAHTYSDNLRLAVGSFGCLCTLARDPANAEMMVKQNCQTTIINAFEKQDYDEQLCEKGVRLCSALVVDNAHLRRLELSNVDIVVANALSAHPNNEKIVSSGMISISRLCFSEAAANKLQSESNIVKVILSIYSKGINDIYVVNECLAALSSICRSGKNAGIMAQKVLRLTATALQTHMSSASCVAHAFSFISNLCVHVSASSVVDTTQIVDAIFNALTAHNNERSTLIRGCHALENIAFGPYNIKDHLKTRGVSKIMNKIMTDNHTDDGVVLAARKVLEAIDRDDSLVAKEYASMKPTELGKRSARDIFGDSIEEKQDVVELPNRIKNFLTAGALIYKYGSGGKRQRHVFITTDMKNLVWKDPKKTDDNRMKVIRIRDVERGRKTPLLQRKTISGSYISKEEHCFVIRGKDRSVDLECSSEEDREMWVDSIQMLIDYTKYQKQMHKLFTSK